MDKKSEEQLQRLRDHQKRHDDFRGSTYTRGKWNIERNRFDDNDLPGITCMTVRHGQKSKVLIADYVSECDLPFIMFAREMYELAILARDYAPDPISSKAELIIDKINSFNK